jgi:DNA polymerase-1
MQWVQDDIEWALTADPPTPQWDAVVQRVTTDEEAARATDELRAADWSTFDVETSGVMWTDTFEVISISCTAKNSWTSYVWDAHALRTSCADALLDWLRSGKASKVAQNGKYDQLAILDAFGVEVKSVIGDTRLWRKLIAPEAPAKLSAMAELVGMGGLKEEADQEMARIKRKIQSALRKGDEHEGPLIEGMPPDVEAAIRMGDPLVKYMYRLMPPEMLARYNARDSVATARLGELLESQLAAEPKLQRTWDEIVAPAAEGLVWVEHWGIGVDFAQVQRFDDHLERREVELTKSLSAYDINWKSHPQVADLLFKTLGLRPVKLTGGGKPSTDAEVLEKLRDKHHVPGDLLDLRFVQKMRGTYASGMREHVRPDGRIHPNIKLAGARSGRTSCTDPNLQNIPRSNSSPEGKMARDCFVAPPGYTLIELDYSQLELRIAAMLSGDPEMRAIFDEGVDYHQRTAELVSTVAWGIQPEAVTKAHRSQAKTINFGVLYGMGDKALAARMGCSVAQAARTREAIMGKLKLLDRWCKAQLSEARKTGEIWTWWDGQRARRRPLFRVADVDDKSRSVAEHGAWNTPVQGTASDYCIRSLGECVEWLVEDGITDAVKLVLTVHDSIMFEARDDMVDEVIGTARDIMQSWPSDGVPLVVDAAVGRAWGSLKEVANE